MKRALFWLVGGAGAAGLVVLGNWTPPDDASYSICLTRRSLGLPCPGCGLTRGLAHLLQGSLARSWELHPLAPLALLDAVGGWVLWGLVTYGVTAPPPMRMVRLVLLGQLAAFFEGAFASEIIRAGITSVARGQWEASATVGLSRTQGYAYVILPQAVPLMLPPLTGILVNLIKHSAVLSFVAVFELTTEARNLIGDTFMSFEVWFVVGPMYLVLTIALSTLVAWLERRVRRRR